MRNVVINMITISNDDAKYAFNDGWQNYGIWFDIVLYNFLDVLLSSLIRLPNLKAVFRWSPHSSGLTRTLHAVLPRYFLIINFLLQEQKREV